MAKSELDPKIPQKNVCESAKNNKNKSRSAPLPMGTLSLKNNLTCFKKYLKNKSSFIHKSKLK